VWRIGELFLKVFLLSCNYLKYILTFHDYCKIWILCFLSFGRIPKIKLKIDIFRENDKILEIYVLFNYIILNDYLDLISCTYPKNLVKSTFSQRLLVKEMLLNQIHSKSAECLKCSSEKSFNSAFTSTCSLLDMIMFLNLFFKTENMFS